MQQRNCHSSEEAAHRMEKRLWSSYSSDGGWVSRIYNEHQKKKPTQLKMINRYVSKEIQMANKHILKSVQPH